MKLFKDYTFTWWQIGIFKIALGAIGITIGAYWSEFWGNYLKTIIVVAAITSGYIMFIALKKK